jgi:hypothetical protein
MSRRQCPALHALDRDLVANLTVVVWQVDHKIPSESATLAVRIADDSHVGGCG